MMKKRKAMYKKLLKGIILLIQCATGTIFANTMTVHSLKELTRAKNKYEALVVLVCPTFLGVKANRVRAAFKSLSERPVYDVSSIKFVLVDTKQAELEAIQSNYSLKSIPALFVLKDGDKEGDELYDYPLMQDMARHIYGVLGDDIRSALEEFKTEQEEEERDRGRGDTTIIYTNYNPYYNPYTYYSWDWPYYGPGYYHSGWSGGLGFYFGGSGRREHYRGGHRGGYRGHGGRRGRR